MTVDRHDPRAEGCGGNAAPYVLGALGDAEHQAFRAHLEGCAVCREEVAALETVTAALPGAAPQLSAPPELKARVMAAVQADVGRARAGAPAARRRAFTLPHRRPLLAPLALGLALVAILAIVIGTGAGGGRGTRVIRAQVSVPGARASLRLSNGHAELKLAGMPQARPGRVYEVWIERSGAPMPTDALFTVASNGAATVGIPGSMTGVKDVLVTSEPLGGSLAPTTSPVITAKLA
jgi:anti-sigma-K factor RskA